MSTPTPTESAVHPRVAKLIRFWQTADDDLARELFADDVVIRFTFGEARGALNYAKFARDFGAAFEGLVESIRLDFAVVEDDRHAVKWTGTGRHTGTVMGIEPTGKEVTLSETHFHRLGPDGKVVEGWSGEFGPGWGMFFKALT